MIDYNKLSKLLGDQDLVEKYLELVKVELPKELKQLNNYLITQNYQEASVIAHSIKGQCNYMGLDNCAELALEIEKQTEALDSEKDFNLLFKKLKLKLYEMLSL